MGTKIIKLVIRENLDGSHCVELASEGLDAIAVFQVFTEMLPRIMKKMDMGELFLARQILHNEIKEIIPLFCRLQTEENEVKE
jgi:hypothetical protein